MSASLQVIGSSSAANGYILTCGDEKLIIEAGCKPKEYLAALNYDLSSVAAVLVSHAHGDHARSINALQSYGLKALAPQSVCDIYPKCKRVEHLHKYKVGGFTIMPLKVTHGDCECYAYYLELPDGQKGIFATDCECFPYSIKDLNFILIEANNSQELIIDRLCDGHDARSSFNSHMELNETISVINRLKNPELNQVVLLHLSDENSDERMFKERVFTETGIRPLIAESSLNVLIDSDF